MPDEKARNDIIIPLDFVGPMIKLDKEDFIINIICTIFEC